MLPRLNKNHSDDLEDPKFRTQAKEKSGNKMPPALTRFLVMNECIKHSIPLISQDSS